MTETLTQVSTTPLIISLNRAWQAIQRNHPDLPGVMIVTGRRRHKSENNIRGQHCRDTWRADGHEGKVAEVWIVGERLAEGAAAVMQTLLHEAAHELACVRDLKDTSNKNRYHNLKFVKLAEELGLKAPDASGGPSLGYSNCTITEQTIQVYDYEIADLNETCKNYVSPVLSIPKMKKQTEYAYCDCDESEGNKVTWTKKLQAKFEEFGISPLVCAFCRQPFLPEGEEESK